MARYITHPGGVILDLDDGSKYHAPYGADLDNLGEGRVMAGHQEQYASRWSDGEKRTNPVADQMAAAHRRAALAENGQPNSTSSPVPGNYSELDEAGAVAVVRALENYPHAQAAILVHERVNKGRRIVEDAGSELARAIAAEQIENLEGVVGPSDEPDEPFEQELHTTGPDAGKTVEVDAAALQTPALADGPLREDNEAQARAEEGLPLSQAAPAGVVDAGSGEVTEAGKDLLQGSGEGTEDMSVKELRQEAADLNIEGRSQMNKDELQDAVDSARARQAADEAG